MAPLRLRCQLESLFLLMGTGMLRDWLGADLGEGQPRRER